MIDKDQHLLWEAYMAEKKADKDYDGDGEVESSEDEYQGSKDKAIKKSMNQEANDVEHPGIRMANSEYSEIHNIAKSLTNKANSSMKLDHIVEAIKAHKQALKFAKSDTNKAAHTGHIKDLSEKIIMAEEVQEEMDNLEFSAQDRISMHEIEYKLQQTFVDAAADWIIADAEALTTPEDYEGYSMSTAFDNAKDFIKDVLLDLPFSDVKRQVEDRNGMILDPEEAAFQASVDDDIRRDDSRLSDMPPREPGI